MSRGSGLGLGSDSLIEEIKRFSVLPTSVCSGGDLSVVNPVVVAKKKKRKETVLTVGKCPMFDGRSSD
ncbi:MAG: hypothetical protein WCX17_01070 [Parcubacteria group bacterium]|jgi:hypothetical protein